MNKSLVYQAVVWLSTFQIFWLLAGILFLSVAWLLGLELGLDVGIGVGLFLGCLYLLFFLYMKKNKWSDVEKDSVKFGIWGVYQFYKKSLSWKKGKVSISDLAWKVYSDYLLISKSSNGRCVCVTCGAKKWWSDSNMHPGHYLEAGKSLKYKFVDDNVHCQCAYCNVMLHGNYKVYTLYMINRYGAERVDNLLNDKLTVSVKNYQYAEMIEKRRSVVVDGMKKYPVK